MLSANDKIQAGKLKLQSFAHPPLVAGDYTLKTGLFINGSGEKRAIPANTSFTNNDLKFTVSAPRFGLDSSLIYSVYPLPGSAGAYHTTLPHAIFTRKTLPWERTIDDVTDKKPWLGLLLLSDAEIKANNVTVSDLDVALVNNNNSDPNLIVPAIKLDTWEKNSDKIKTLQLPLPLFKSITPMATELNYLAHTRQVDTSNKENTDTNPKGWFSSVICNRLPQPGMLNTVFLVSLEGHGNNIQSETALPADNGKNIRLVLLHQWSFIEQGATFEELAEMLISNTKPLKIDLEDLLNSKNPGGVKNLRGTINDAAKRAFGYGYSPVNHDRRTGAKSVSWYRGPLVPADIAQPQQYIYGSADQALRYDAASGMFDISYSAAWQLGRVLALQSPGFFTAISNWKSDYKRERPLNIAKDILQKKGDGIRPEDLSALVNDAESDEVLSDYLIELWNKI